MSCSGNYGLDDDDDFDLGDFCESDDESEMYERKDYHPLRQDLYDYETDSDSSTIELPLLDQEVSAGTCKGSDVPLSPPSPSSSLERAAKTAPEKNASPPIPSDDAQSRPAGEKENDADAHSDFWLLPQNLAEPSSVPPSSPQNLEDSTPEKCPLEIPESVEQTPTTLTTLEASKSHAKEIPVQDDNVETEKDEEKEIVDTTPKSSPQSMASTSSASSVTNSSVSEVPLMPPPPPPKPKRSQRMAKSAEPRLDIKQVVKTMIVKTQIGSSSKQATKSKPNLRMSTSKKTGSSIQGKPKMPPKMPCYCGADNCRGFIDL